MRALYKIVSLIAVTGVLASCEDKGKAGNGPIVLGDSTSIVTETDSTYLSDMVLDYQPVAPTQEEPKAEPKAEPKQVDTPAEAQANTQPATQEQPKEEPKAIAKGNGLTIDLKELDLFIPNVAAKGSNGSYTLTKGDLDGKQLKVTDGTVQKISQRYQTVVIAENGNGTLVLDKLSATTGWQPVKGSGSTYTITGLDDRRLIAPKVTNATIRDAITRAARNQRLSKAQTQKWLNSTKSIRAANQKPLSVELRSVMWKIDGKDAKGKPFSKQVRVDLPI
ncbi:MAG: hypothetical protein EOP51_03970 [Sphingobacteriales bacterium]|nr:MAG: hypothetical protein EOP51_03970 [Sphingobacteriales bacterium]